MRLIGKQDATFPMKDKSSRFQLLFGQTKAALDPTRLLDFKLEYQKAKKGIYSVSLYFPKTELSLTQEVHQLVSSYPHLHFRDYPGVQGESLLPTYSKKLSVPKAISGWQYKHLILGSTG